MDLLVSIEMSIETYFKGERDLAYILIPFACAMFGLAYYTYLHYKGQFAQALTITSLIIAFGFILAGVIMYVKAGIDLDNNLVLVKKDAIGFIAVELERVSKMNETLWPALKGLWSVLIILCLAGFFFMTNEVVKGVALALLVGSSAFLVVDILAAKRAEIYQHALQQANQ